MKILFLLFIGFNLIYLPFTIHYVYGYVFLWCLFYQDYKTMYISKRWIPLVFLFYLLSHSYISFIDSFCTGFFFLCLTGIMKYLHPNWLGSADVCFLTFFGFFLGYQRMFIALEISVMIGFIWMLVLYMQKKECILPYLSCLSIGVYIAWIKGYTIFDYVCNFIKF